MIKALIEKHGDIMIEELPIDYTKLIHDLCMFGIRGNPDHLYIADGENREVNVKLYSDNEVGKHLCLMFDERDTLHNVNALCHLLKNAADILSNTDIENNIIHGQYMSRKELIDDIRQAVRSRDMDYKATFFFSLRAELLEEGETEGYQVSGRYLADFEDDIRAQLEYEQAGDDGDMTQYFDEDDHPTLAKKIKSIVWDAKTVGNELYGYVEVHLRKPMAAKEEESLKDWITGQNSDGFGEGFEQHPIDTDEGELYVSFWGDGYFICNEDEFQEYLSEGQTPEMGGI